MEQVSKEEISQNLILILLLRNPDLRVRHLFKLNWPLSDILAFLLAIFIPEHQTQ